MSTLGYSSLGYSSTLSLPCDLHDVVLFGAFPEHEQPPVDRVSRPQPRAFVRDSTVIDVNASAADEPRRFAFRRRQSARREQLDDRHALAAQPVRGED